MNMKKIKESIRARIIHLLGGVTREENVSSNIQYLYFGSLTRVRRIRNYLDLMNGMPAEEWCKAAYNYIVRIEKELGEKTVEKEEE